MHDSQPEPWRWDQPTWRGHVQRTRAGRPAGPFAWPGGGRLADGGEVLGNSRDDFEQVEPVRAGETHAHGGLS
jgi:peptidoglycan-N-acetylglucosamine deacetylase